MKKTVRCLNCDRVIRKHGSFTVELEEEQVVGGVKTGQLMTKIGRLCRKCTFKAGYKVKGEE